MAVSANLAVAALTSAMLAFRKRATLARIGFVDRSNADQIGETGDTVRVTRFNRPGDPNDAAMATAHDTTLVTPAVTKYDLLINSWKEYHWDVSSKDAGLYNAQNTFVRPAQNYGAALADYMERDLFLSLAAGSGFVQGTVGAAPFSGVNGLNTISAVRKALVKRDADSSNMVFYVTPDAAENLLNQSAFVSASERGDAGELAGSTGLLGNRLGFTFVESNNIASIARGADSGAFQGAAAIGATQVSVDGAGADGINRGEIIRPGGGTNPTYAVEQGISGASGNITLDRPLQAAVADNATLSRIADDDPNFAIVPGALMVVMRPTSPPVGTPGADDVSLTDPETGFSLNLTAAKIRNGTRYYLSALWGGRVVAPEQVERVHG